MLFCFLCKANPDKQSINCEVSSLFHPLNPTSHLFRMIHKQLSMIHLWKDLHMGIRAWLKRAWHDCRAFIIQTRINSILRPYPNQLLPWPFAAYPAFFLPILGINFIPTVALHKAHQLEKSPCFYRYRHFSLSFKYLFRDTVSL